MNTAEQKRAFLDEYRRLCDRYGLYIGDCGCCRSPWVAEAGFREESAAQEIGDHITHLLQVEGLA